MANGKENKKKEKNWLICIQMYLYQNKDKYS